MAIFSCEPWWGAVSGRHIPLPRRPSTRNRRTRRLRMCSHSLLPRAPGLDWIFWSGCRSGAPTHGVEAIPDNSFATLLRTSEATTDDHRNAGPKSNVSNSELLWITAFSIPETVLDSLATDKG